MIVLSPEGQNDNRLLGPHKLPSSPGEALERHFVPLNYHPALQKHFVPSYHPAPKGRRECSPALQRWEIRIKEDPVPEGRPMYAGLQSGTSGSQPSLDCHPERSAEPAFFDANTIARAPDATLPKPCDLRHCSWFAGMVHFHRGPTHVDGTARHQNSSRKRLQASA
jgi:hypothetical protein